MGSALEIFVEISVFSYWYQIKLKIQIAYEQFHVSNIHYSTEQNNISAYRLFMHIKDLFLLDFEYKIFSNLNLSVSAQSKAVQ